MLVFTGLGLVSVVYEYSYELPVVGQAGTGGRGAAVSVGTGSVVDTGTGGRGAAVSVGTGSVVGRCGVMLTAPAKSRQIFAAPAVSALSCWIASAASLSCCWCWLEWQGLGSAGEVGVRGAFMAFFTLGEGRGTALVLCAAAATPALIRIAGMVVFGLTAAVAA